MATKAAYKRLTKEYIAIQNNPAPYLIAKPLENNILEWHYVIRGPPDTPYHNGEYHGYLQFPVEYPFKPPSIRMITPSGRFHPNTRLCLSMSDFHPSSWNPSWSVSTILNGLLSFMTGDEATTGSIKTSDTDKRIFASRSHQFNMKDPKFREIFPELCVPEPVSVEILYPLNNDSSSGSSSNNNDNDNNKSGTNNGTRYINEASRLPHNNNQIQKRQQINQNDGSNIENNKNLSNDNKDNNNNNNKINNSSSNGSSDTSTNNNNIVVQRSLFDKWRKWIIITLVFLYLIISKILARKSEALSSNDY